MTDIDYKAVVRQALAEGTNPRGWFRISPLHWAAYKELFPEEAAALEETLRP